ncbi:MAG TPA: alpha/beta fold hydrolase [Polyangia bacterium]|jgi:pimeloyl-ACP methyl ester carboxylesterase|nr:alpha/beta fold hydrolase [Polyangia bacterium]
MREKASLFGEPPILLGITTEPSIVAAERPAVLLLNAGLVHRVGPARKSVRLARRLAEAGFLTLRFDLSGIGDSEPRRDTLSFDERAILDVQQAMDFLQCTRGINHFVLMGLCSGADNSFRTALRDPRVHGAIMIDTFGYRTTGFYLRHYWRRLFRPQAWQRFARRLTGQARARVERAIGIERPAAPAAAPPQYAREFPPQAEFVSGVRTLINRGVNLYFIYSAAMEGYYNHEGQLAEFLRAVDFKNRLQTKFFADSDHTFTDLRSQRALIDTVAAWLASVAAD